MLYVQSIEQHLMTYWVNYLAHVRVQYTRTSAPQVKESTDGGCHDQDDDADDHPHLQSWQIALHHVLECYTFFKKLKSTVRGHNEEQM